MKTPRDIVYMRPDEWHKVIPLIQDKPLAESLSSWTKGRLAPDCDWAHGGLRPDQINEIESLYIRIFGGETEVLAA